MFGIGMTELLVIVGLALVVMGPKKLPEMAKAMGKGFAEFKRATNELKNTIEVEARTEEVRKTREKMEKDGKLTPPNTAESSAATDDDDWQTTSGQNPNIEEIRKAKLAQTMAAEEDDPSLLEESAEEQAEATDEQTVVDESTTATTEQSQDA